MTDSHSTTPERICKVCKDSYPLTTDFWHRDKTSKDGFTYTCKECAKKRSRKWVADNPERNKENCKRRYYEKPEARAEYRETHKAEIAATKRNWRKNNPATVKRQKSTSQKRNRSSANVRAKRYRDTHPENGHIHVQRRLARKRSLPDTFTTDEWQACLDWWGHSCAYCGEPLTEETRHEMDHVIPLSADDCPGTVAGNIVPACRPCNASKNNNELSDWLLSLYDPFVTFVVITRIASYFASLVDQP